MDNNLKYSVKAAAKTTLWIKMSPKSDNVDRVTNGRSSFRKKKSVREMAEYKTKVGSQKM